MESLTREHLTFVTPAVLLDVPSGPSLQDRARYARYKALAELAPKFSVVMTAHNLNDNAETKLYQFLKGQKANGIPSFRRLDSTDVLSHVYLSRPLLQFSRKDIEVYARCFRLKWCEDSSNKTDHYARNKIRHHLIPWIETNINSGIIKMLG